MSKYSLKDCGELKEDGLPCTFAGKYEDGKCGFHTDTKKLKRKGIKGNTHNMKHGLTMTHSRYYENLDEGEQDLIHDMYLGFLEEAPFGEESRGKCKLLHQACIDIHMKSRSQDYISDEGITQYKTKGFADGHPVKEPEENTLFITSDRLSRTALKTLKELGILDPKKTEMEKDKTLIEVLSGLAESEE